MKISRRYLGKVVEIRWKDPNFKQVDIGQVRKGRAALATLVEYGVVHDITDGVVLIAHSAASGEGDPTVTADEIARTAIAESLIEKITLFGPVKR
jgi:hypothetical protein